MAVTVLTLGVAVQFLPIQVKINVCAPCGFRMDLVVAICPRCGVPNMWTVGGKSIPQVGSCVSHRIRPTSYM